MNRITTQPIAKCTAAVAGATFVVITFVLLFSPMHANPFEKASDDSNEGSKLVLVENGASRAPIVVFEGAPPITRQAANELAEYIEKISGAKPKMIEGRPDPLPESAIWFGYQPVLKTLFPKVDFDFQHPEQILIAVNEPERESYPSLEAFTASTGYEKHGRRVEYDIFVNDLPIERGTAAPGTAAGVLPGSRRVIS